MKLTCVGTGDAFGSGGRLNACFHLQTKERQVLIDCGSSSLIGLERCGIDPAAIDVVVVSHLHGDHFGGIPYLFLEGRYRSHRTRPLTLVGPTGLEARVDTLARALYPGLSAEELAFSVSYRVLEAEETQQLGDLQILPLRVEHGESAHAYGFRMSVGGKVISYSGDTEWTDSLLALAQGSDLLITECFTYDRVVPGHLNHQTLLEARDRLGARRVVLTHLGPEMLEHVDASALDVVSDGDILEI